MLSSITPLGERSRGATWGVTVACFVVGSALAGTALGWLAGLLGSVTLDGVSGDLRLTILAGAIALGLTLDLTGRLPTVRRQVNENWLTAYRGWVYGAGFGLQLGAGAATIVTTAAVYLTFLAAVLTADPVAGAVIGGTFGLLRGAAVLAAVRVRTPQRLISFSSRVQSLSSPAGRLANAALLTALLWTVIEAAG
jgi:hypothetical protein